MSGGRKRAGAGAPLVRTREGVEQFARVAPVLLLRQHDAVLLDVKPERDADVLDVQREPARALVLRLALPRMERVRICVCRP